MACKIQISETLKNDIAKDAVGLDVARLDIAQQKAKVINKQYGFDVVKVFEGKQEYINTVVITAPPALIDDYHEFFTKLEEDEARVPQREDAKRAGKEYKDRHLFDQTKDVKASAAADATIAKIKESAKEMGISIQSLMDYAKENPAMDTKSVNGVADLTKGTIAIAQGMEDVALTEEIVHIATAILEQTNPKLVTELISKIGRFSIYQKTLDAYRNNKNYQLGNGKPNIRKIKKEAVDKLIAEVMINQLEGSTQFPELTEEANRNLVKQWWDTIMDYIRGVYRKTNIDIFESAAKQITDSKIGTVDDIASTETFYQIKNEAVDKIYNTVADKDNRLELVNPNGPDRHYLYDGKRVAKSVTEKIKTGNTMSERTGINKMIDEQKRDWGSAGHLYIEQYIGKALIDKDGYKRPIQLDVDIKTELSPELQSHIRKFAEELINSYDKDTRFAMERQVVNEKVKGKLASALDFIAIEPYTKPDGTKDAKVDILDWKFTSVNKNKTDDLPWYKTKEWKAQMGEYTKIMYSYGVQPNQIRKARMIPFILNYEYKSKGKPETGLASPKSVEIGNLDSVKETKLYLLPVPVNTETTGNPTIDRLLKSLRAHYEKLYRKPVGPEERSVKIHQINELSKAIRRLHLQLNFEPLVNVGETFLRTAAKTFKHFENIDYSKLTRDDIQAKLGDLLEYKKSAEKFATLDEAFLAYTSKEGMSAEDKKTLASLERISSATERMFGKIEQLQREYTVQLRMTEELVAEEYAESILDPEVAVSGFTKTFLEASKLSPKIIKLAANLMMNASSLVDRKVANRISDYAKVLLPLEEEAKAKGVNAFDMIGAMDERGLHLIKKISGEFWEEISKAKKAKNKKFFLDNMHKDEFNKLAKDAIDKGIDVFNTMQFSSEEEHDISEREFRITKLKDSLDITRETFNGYENPQFGYLFNKSVIEEGHYSEEYERMAKSKAALDVWNFFIDLNIRAKGMGYLDKQGSSFFPLMEATTLDKFFQTSNILGQSKDFFQDLYKVRINESQHYSKIDPETNQLKKQVPKYFTRTDKNVDKLSRDLNKVGAMWIKSIYQYENARNMENVLLTLHSVEKAKGSLILENGEVVFEGGSPKVNEKVNKNAEILETIADDYLYGLSENLGSLGNVAISTVADKLKKDGDVESKEKAVVSTKKVMSNANTLVRVFALGMKPLITGANWMGTQMQAFITAGNLYTPLQYSKNNIKISTGIGLTTIEKGVLDLIIPLNEDIADESRRKIARKQGLAKWLGTWTFTEVMMSSMSIPERRLQYANAMSFNENSMIKNGKIVNIRQYLTKQDRSVYEKDDGGNYVLSYTERKAIKDTYEQRVTDLQKSSSLINVAKIENDEVVLPEVSEEELAKYRTKIIEYNRTLNGQMNLNNKADYTRDTIFKSFMMFKGWMPKLVSTRALDIHKNLETEEWDYGRTRVFAKVVVQLGMRNITKMRDIMNGTDEGLRLMSEMLETKRQDHFKKTGQVLEITEEEFFDLIQKELSREVKELATLVSMIGLIAAAKAARPPEDATALEKNRYRFWAKLTNKITDEITFYYNPLAFQGMTSGSILPALSLLTKVEKLFTNLAIETKGYVINDPELIKAAHPTKYFFNLIPLAAQFQTEVLPYVDPELAKELGIKVTSQSRGMSRR